MRRVSYIGRQYGQLTVLEQVGESAKNRKAYWLCQCVCGTKRIVRSISLRMGVITSCGCLKPKKEKKPTIAICDRTLVRRIHELAKASDTTPQAWTEELIDTWLREHRMNIYKGDIDRHTEQKQDTGWDQFDDVYSAEDVQEVLL